MIPQATGIHYDPTYERHDTGPNHPESAHRYKVLREALEKLPKEFVRLPRRTAKLAEILLAHKRAYHDIVKQDVEGTATRLRTGDTAISKDSYEVVLEATGAVLNAADAIMKGDVRNAFCAIRPPGHHASADNGMGFCMFNHVAIAARYLQETHGVAKVAIIDWDVHHGNGTEDIFIEDPSVLYISLHQDGIYPGTGDPEKRGIGEAKGTNLNIPLPARSDGKPALAAWDKQITPVIDEFKPDFILISAGFDARINDPIGGLTWDDKTFSEMTRRCQQHAKKHSHNRILSMLEGGYNPEGIASAAVAHVKQLAKEA